MAKGPQPWTAAEDSRVDDFEAQGWSDQEIADSLGRSKQSIQERRRRRGKTDYSSRKRASIASAPLAPGKESFSNEQTSNSQVITSRSSTVRTLEDALAVAQVDLTVWEVERFIANKWDMGAKTKIDQLQAMELWQVKVWLRRRVPKSVSDAANGIIEKMNRHAPKYPKMTHAKRIRDPHLFFVGLHDHHFGKLAWAAETGENYDLKIAEALYQNAGEELVRKASGFPVEKFVLPLGNDFLHIDGLDNMTTGGTPQDVDGRFAKIFEVGQYAVIRLIDFLINIAPVDVLWVPGNHDYQSSYMLAQTIKAWYRQCPRVMVDSAPRPRKRVHYGVNLIGCTHGCDERFGSLPGIMAQEWPKEWSESKCREWLVGDKHKPKETHYNTADTYDGVMVRILSSLAGTDLWHYKKGYIGGRGKAAQGLLYSKSDGFSGQFNANVWKD